MPYFSQFELGFDLEKLFSSSFGDTTELLPPNIAWMQIMNVLYFYAKLGSDNYPLQYEK